MTIFVDKCRACGNVEPHAEHRDGWAQGLCVECTCDDLHEILRRVRAGWCREISFECTPGHYCDCDSQLRYVQEAYNTNDKVRRAYRKGLQWV